MHSCGIIWICYKTKFREEKHEQSSKRKETTFTIEKASVSKLTAKTYTYDGKEKEFAS